MNIKNMYITKNRPYTKRAKTTKIAVHYIGNPNTSAEANRNYFNSNNDDVSSNYIIGLNGEIICCIPDEEVAWCTCQANSYSVSIENCHPDSTGKLNSKTYNSLVELCVYLCKKYKLNENDDRRLIMKTWAKRSLRTFLQTAVGYIAVNIAATDLTVKSAVLGLAVSAVSAGLAAVMNLKEV